MRWTWAILFVFALTTALASGEDFLSARSGPNPNHLVPIDSFMNAIRGLSEYDQLLAKHLFLTRGDLGRMLVKPSFTCEYCLSVDWRAKDGQRPEFANQHEGDKYFITVTEPKEQIWAVLHNKSNTGGEVRVEVVRIDREIGRDLATAIQRVWGKALLLTRYPRPSNIRGGTYDGTTYCFSMTFGGWLAGETHSPNPEQGLPYELTQIGLDLAGRCKRGSFRGFLAIVRFF